MFMLQGKQITVGKVCDDGKSFSHRPRVQNDSIAEAIQITRQIVVRSGAWNGIWRLQNNHSLARHCWR